MDLQFFTNSCTWIFQPFMLWFCLSGLRWVSGPDFFFRRQLSVSLSQTLSHWRLLRRAFWVSKVHSLISMSSGFLLPWRNPCDSLLPWHLHSHCRPRLLLALLQWDIPAPPWPVVLRWLLPSWHIFSERWRCQCICVLTLPCGYLWPRRGFLRLHPLPIWLLLHCPWRHLSRHMHRMPSWYLHPQHWRLQPQGLRLWPGLCVPRWPAALLAQHPRLCCRLRTPGLRVSPAAHARRLWLQRLRRGYLWCPWGLHGMPHWLPLPRPPFPSAH